jgi:hypothetical protein
MEREGDERMMDDSKVHEDSYQGQNNSIQITEDQMLDIAENVF